MLSSASSCCHWLEPRSLSTATKASAPARRVAPAGTEPPVLPCLGRAAAAGDGERGERERTASRRRIGHSPVGCAPHQLRNEVGAVVPSSTCADALGDRQLDAEPLREVAQHRRRRQPLDDHADLRDRLVGRRRPARSARRRGGCGRGDSARDDQVAHAGEARERLGRAAAGLAEPGHLGQPARDQRRLGVVAEAEAVDAAGGERDHVLRRGAELDADEVVVDVDAEDGRVDRVLQLAGERRRPRSRSPPRPAAPPRSPRRCSGRRGRRPAGRATSVESRSPRRRVEALGQAEHGRVAGQAARRPRAKARLGTASDDELGLRRPAPRRRVVAAIPLEVDVRQVARVAPGLARSRRACSASRQASVTSWPRRRAARRTPCPTSRRRRRPLSRSA